MNIAQNHMLIQRWLGAQYGLQKIDYSYYRRQNSFTEILNQARRIMRLTMHNRLNVTPFE